MFAATASAASSWSIMDIRFFNSFPRSPEISTKYYFKAYCCETKIHLPATFFRSLDTCESSTPDLSEIYPLIDFTDCLECGLDSYWPAWPKLSMKYKFPVEFRLSHRDPLTPTKPGESRFVQKSRPGFLPFETGSGRPNPALSLRGSELVFPDSPKL